MSGDISTVRVEFDQAGSLPTTHETQGSDMGLCGGLLGFEVSDHRLLDYESELKRSGIEIEYVTGDLGHPHPNTYRLALRNAKEMHTLIAVSTGGGMIEILEIDECAVSIRGDLYVNLIFFCGDGLNLTSNIKALQPDADPIVKRGPTKSFVYLQSHVPLGKNLIDSIKKLESVVNVKTLLPVLPIPTPANMRVPFANCQQMLEFNQDKGMRLGELAIEYESTRGGVSKLEISDKMMEIIGVIKNAIQTGIRGTDYQDRILGCQSTPFKKSMESGHLIDLGALNTAILYVTALMEVKSAMGVIVAAPTAGSCGGLPGTILGAADTMGFGEKEISKAFFAAGIIGIFISRAATFAAEVSGCQAECGSGSGMAAAALVELMGGTAEQAVAAASMALQNSFGMVCDPVANRVEVPCLGKNLMAASNAFACANIAIAGFDPVIPLDETIATMDTVGKSIPGTLRCTALGGLSITATSKKIERQLKANRHRKK
jgi:L-serine dehydratase